MKKRYMIWFHPVYSQCATIWFDEERKVRTYPSVEEAMDVIEDLEKTKPENTYYLVECAPLYTTTLGA